MTLKSSSTIWMWVYSWEENLADQEWKGAIYCKSTIGSSKNRARLSIK